MSNSNLEHLRTILAAAGTHPHVLAAPGGSLLITLRGSRILGVFPADCPANLLWTNRALNDQRQAKSLVRSGQWNLGGDRCWLAPEVELHFKSPDHPSHTDYTVPAAIDPGDYRLEAVGPAAISMITRGQIHNLVSGRSFGFEIWRQISLCDAPCTCNGSSYVGYTTRTALSIRPPDRQQACYGLWQLLQVPPGGQVLIPTRGLTELVDYFQTGVADHCRTAANHLIFPVTGQTKHKLGLSAAGVCGRMAYLRQHTQHVATLIVRDIPALSAGGGPTRVCFADYPFWDRCRRNVALQFYNDDGQAGGFGEMEHHSVAASADNLFQTLDLCHTWCFAGPSDKIRALCAELLGRREMG